MTNIFSPTKIKNINIKNRIVLPPMVRFSLVEKDGYVTKGLIDWYEDIAKNGVGMIVVEASCVCENYKLRDNQIGIWDDDFIPGLRQVADVCRKHDVPSIIQIHHAGFKDGIATVSTKTIDNILDQFVEAFVRAKKCGFDGIEIHGAHTYLLSQLNSRLWNIRDDKYGGTFEKRMTFNRLLVERTRDLFDDNFILAYRMGGNEPTLDDGIEIAKYLEKLGVDLLHVSSGVPDPDYKSDVKIEVPSDFPLDWVIYLGVEIKKHVDIPVIGVRKIKTEEQASWLIENNLLDFVAIGRSMIARPFWMEWAKKNYDRRIAENIKITPESLIEKSKTLTTWLKKKN